MQRILSSLIVLGAVFSVQVGAASQAVSIADANLRAVIENKLGKTRGAPITEAEMANLTSLRADRKNISDLTGLEFAINLTRLELSSNSISDISALSGLTNLTLLDLDYNSISDITLLSGLTNLAWLELSSNSISDISALSGLTNLTSLSLGSNSISDITPLSSSTNLDWLDIYYNNISDITPLSGLTNLRWLLLGGNSISDITPLSGLTNLISLSLGSTSISDISALSGLTNLISLLLDDTSISDITPLSGLTNLERLDLGSTSISDISALSGLTNLTSLLLGDTSISDISALSGLTNLTSLDLDYSGPLPSWLVNLTHLETLYLDPTQSCAPTDVAFQRWLRGIEVRPGVRDCPDLTVRRLTASHLSVREDAEPTEITLTVTLAEAAPADETVVFAFVYPSSGTPAIRDVDYSANFPLGLVITIPAGETKGTAHLTLSPHDNDERDGNKGVGVRATASGGSTQTDITIIDDESLSGGGGTESTPKMYWTDFHTGKIQRSNLDGSNGEDLVTGLRGSPRGIALDVSSGKMYWTEYDYDTGTGKIQRSNLDGSNREDLVTGLRGGPYGIALDVSSGKMYWTDFTGTSTGKIQRSNLDGSNVEDLVTIEFSNPRGIALDVGNGKMYWTGTGEIQRSNLDGSNVEDLVTVGFSAPRGIALDVGNGKMYWTGYYGKIRRANLDGSNVEDLITGLGNLYGLALDISGQSSLPRDDYEGPHFELTVGEAIEPIVLPASTGGSPPYEYSVSNLPAGLSFDPATRTIAGTPTEATDGPITVIYAGTDALGSSASLPLLITVNPASSDSSDSSLAFVGNTAIPNQSFTAGTAITPLVLPAASGGTPPYEYSVSNLSAGLSFDPATRTIAGTPTEATDGPITVTYTVSDSSGSAASLTFTITVNSPLSFGDFFGAGKIVSTASHDLTAIHEFVVDQRVAGLTLPEASGGTAPLTYSLSPTLPAGLTFDPATRTIAGTPLAAGETAYTYTVTDANGATASLSLQTLPTAFSLASNFPNPFNPTTTIQYALPHAADVALTVYNVVGQPVRMLVDEHQSAGRYAVEWDATDDSGHRLSSGMYFYRLQAGGEFREVKKMLLLK